MAEYGLKLAMIMAGARGEVAAAGRMGDRAGMV
jgi:hypothetical protein